MSDSAIEPASFQARYTHPHTINFKVGWVAHAPVYTNDRGVYIWQAFRKAPEPDFAWIHNLDKNASRDIRSFSLLNNGESLITSKANHAHIREGRTSWSALNELTFLFRALHSVANSSMLKFIDESYKELRDLVCEIRKTQRRTLWLTAYIRLSKLVATLACRKFIFLFI